MVPIIYRSSDVGAPVLNCTAGSMISLLKACLINGFAARTPSSITRSGSVATVTLTGHGFLAGTNVQIAGASQTAYNGRFPITIVDANTFTYPVSGSPATPATGALTVQLPAAGWTVAVEDTVNHRIILQNDHTTGSGRYFRVQDDGYVIPGNPAGAPANGNGWVNIANVLGMRSYTDVNTPVSPFPRLISGGNLIDNYALGVTIMKGGDNVTSPTNTRPWMVIADNRTCHIVTTSASAATTAMPTDNTGPYGEKTRGIAASFGDMRSLNSSNSTLPKAYVFGGGVGDTGTTGGGSLDSNYVVPYNNLTTVYLDTSLENGAHTVRGLMKAELTSNGPNQYVMGGNCGWALAVNEGTYEHYPSPSTLGFTAEKIYLYEDLSDPIRANIASNGYRYISGWVPGLCSSPHTTTPSNAYRVGDELTVQTDPSGKRYLIYSLLKYIYNPSGADTYYAGLYAFALDDWWL